MSTSPCDSPMGEFSCLRVRRTRITGGMAEKEFHFARGIGKVREVGSNQLEELTACGPGGITRRRGRFRE